MQGGMDSGHISRKTKRITLQKLGGGMPLDAARPLLTDLLGPLPACILREPPGAVPVAVAIGRFANQPQAPQIRWAG